MTDNDIDKVGKRPWFVSGRNTIRPADNFPAVLTISRRFAEYPFEDHVHALEHIVHCVNVHDELVQALKDYIELIDSGDAGFWEPTELRELLTRAKGGAA